MAKIENPKIFISYCWSNDAYIEKVVDFAKRRECQEKCVSFWVRLNFHTSALGFGTWN